MSLSIIYIASAPIGSPAPVRISNEWMALSRAAQGSGRGIALEGANPASSSITSTPRERLTRPLIHVAAHGSAEGLELEQEDGAADIVSARRLALGLGAVDPQLVVLNGCHTELLAQGLRDEALGSPLIVCVGRVTDEVATQFTSDFYRELLASGDIAASFQAVQIALEERYGTSPYRLVGDEGQVTDLGDGKARQSRSFVNAYRRATATDGLYGTSDVLTTAYENLSEPDVNVTWVTGPPLSGVSTALKAIADRFAWWFDDAVAIDVRGLGDLPVADAVARELGDDGNRDLTDLLRTHRALIRLDHFDDLRQEDANAVLRQLSQLGPEVFSHVLIGCNDVPAGTLLGGTVKLRPLARRDALELMKGNAPNSRDEDLQHIIDAGRSWPGQLLLCASDLANGASPQDVAEVRKKGLDRRTKYEALVARTLAEKHVAIAFQALSLLGGAAMRGAVSRLAQALHTDQDEDQSWFDDALALLRRVNAVEVEMLPSRSPADTVPAYVIADVQWTRFARLPDPLPAPFRTGLLGVAELAEQRFGNGAFEVTRDPAWCGPLIRLLAEVGCQSQALALGKKLLERNGLLIREGVPASVRELAEITLPIAMREDDDDMVGYLSLLVGQDYYIRGQQDKAQETFRNALSFGFSGGRRLQLLRALGQIAYRQEEYEAALKLYDEANEHRSEAESSQVATLDHHRAKALVRLGRESEAIALLDEVIQRRQADGDVLWLIKAEHERAKIIARTDVDAAATTFIHILTAARVGNFHSFVSAPAYELLKCRLRQGQLDEARNLQALCSEAAERNDDAFWRVYSSLAASFIELESGAGSVSEQLAETAAMADRMGYPQVRTDAVRWVVESMGLTPSDADLSLGIDKALKALRYSKQPDRLDSATARYRSLSDEIREMEYADNRWSCDCDLYSESGSCTHVLAMRSLIPDVVDERHESNARSFDEH